MGTPGQGPVGREGLEAMARALVHRGPDGEGYHLRGEVGLAHRRLAVIDLEGGAQPMADASGEVWVSYNGEVYNFQELRRELEGRGHRFRTRCDTEVLLAAYAQWGADLCPRLSGMFAFGLVDYRRGTLLLARDRLGVKPLYWALQGGRLYFASELKALRAAGVGGDLDEEALADYLALGYINAPRTVYRGVRKLPGAHLLQVPLDRPGEVPPRPRRWWDLGFRPERGVADEEALVEELRHRLGEAVRRRLVSDVPLGALLSGGLDSSSVVALMRENATGRVQTFSIGFEDAAYDERTHARRAADHLGTEHHEEVVQPAGLELFEDLVRQLDEPFADSSALPTYRVSRMARRSVTVALSGDGGDEAFGGYVRYARMAQTRFLDTLSPRLRRAALAPLGAVVPEWLHGAGWISRATWGPAARYHSLCGVFRPEEFPALLEPELARRLAAYHPLAAFEAALGGSDRDGTDLVGRLQGLDLVTYLPGDILTKVDRTSMAVSLEVRSPFLDHEVLEFAARLPLSLRLGRRGAKHLLRRAAEAWLPPEIVRRRKQGFGVPLHRWFREDLLGFAESRLVGPSSSLVGMVRPSYARRLLAHHRKGMRDFSARIWCLLVLEQWLRGSR
ncbi:MAG: asparagine synthase (glutamine-hydrolyzing) [Planctomycetes bacterium]|nr:asparagine synthase (glutamine-hydrolyzing) [Planctomycetota bacterium]